MDISSTNNSLLLNIANGATRSGDAVAVSVLKKAMDLQASQASQLIESAAQSVPRPDSRVGSTVDTYA